MVWFKFYAIPLCLGPVRRVGERPERPELREATGERRGGEGLVMDTTLLVGTDDRPECRGIFPGRGGSGSSTDGTGGDGTTSTGAVPGGGGGGRANNGSPYGAGGNGQCKIYVI